MMKKYSKLFLMFLFLSPVLAQKPVDVWVFYSQGCPHCHGLLSFLKEIKPNYPLLNVTTYEIHNQTNYQLFTDIADKCGVKIEGVPTTFINGKGIIGYSSWIGGELEKEIQQCTQKECISPSELLKPACQPIEQIKADVSSIQTGLTLPILLGAAVADSVNPCEFAVLIILLTTILGVGSRVKALKAGFAFTIAIYISYLLMGLGLFTAIQLSGFSYSFAKIIGVIAIIVGLFNLKDFIRFGAGGFVMEVPMSWRPRMKRLIQGVVSVPGAFLVGVIVSLFLTPCTSGPYIIILGMLANQATIMAALPLLLLYNLVFVLPMIAITLLIYYGLTSPEKADKWRVKKIRYLHLVAGLIMVLMGAAIILYI